MVGSIVILTIIFAYVEAQFGLDFLNSTLNKGADLNPAHQLCQPCLFAAGAIKNTNQQPRVKEAEKKSCNSILHNEVVCNGAVEVVGIYLNWTPAQKICETFRMCGGVVSKNEKKRFKRAPAKTTKRPDEIALQVLAAFEGLNDKRPASDRFPRQSGQADLNSIKSFEKLLVEHSDEIKVALQQFLDRFHNALELYIDGTNPQ